MKKLKIGLMTKINIYKKSCLSITLPQVTDEQDI